MIVLAGKNSMTRRRPRRALPRAAGMTLLELVIVIVLIGSVLAVVGGKIVQNKHRAEAKLAQTQLNSLAGTVDQYKSDVGSFPENLDQLVTAPGNAPGWLGPYTRAADLKDPWNNAIQYRVPGDNGQPFQLLSLGVDGKSGGDGVDKDVVAP
jgi:general secretion pathway protein G